MDPQLVLFRRQYFQLFEPDFLAWPPKSLLRDAGVQQWLYKQCFDTDANPYLPSDRYRLRVLKPLLRKVEQSIENPEEDVGSSHHHHLFCPSLYPRIQHPYRMQEFSS